MFVLAVVKTAEPSYLDQGKYDGAIVSCAIEQRVNAEFYRE